MCHLKHRKVKNVCDAVLAFHDNEDKPVAVDETSSKDSFGLICENADHVKEAAEMFLFSGNEVVYVSPYQEQSS